MKEKRKNVELINSLYTSIQYLDSQIAQQNSMINAIQKIVDRHAASKKKIEDQIKSITIEEND